MTAGGKQRVKDLFPPTKERSFRIYQRRTYIRVNTGCLRNRLNLCGLLPVNAFLLCTFCSYAPMHSSFIFVLHSALLVKNVLNTRVHTKIESFI
jgi:hypothetical protein